MSIFSDKSDMNKLIKNQQSKIEYLQSKCIVYQNDNSDLKKEIAKLQEEHEKYFGKYGDTGLECDFCYATLQVGFIFCPKCGKKINKTQKAEVKKENANVFQVEKDGEYVLINQYNGFSNKKVVIPSNIDGKRVIGIWNRVFEKCADIEEVVFEEGCQYIGKNAFANCTNLKKVRLPKSLLEIGDSAFSGCAIEELAVPPNVKVIGSYAFSSRSLKHILLPDQLKYISAGMLFRTSIEEINIPQNVLHIGYSAFSDTKLKEVELPDNLYSIDKYAFDTASLKKIIMHSNIKIISSDIFGQSTHPIVCCAAGSKGQLYARKYGLECQEISLSSHTNVETCASSIILVLGSITKGYTVEYIYNIMGINKAETWSWEYKGFNKLIINKYMDMNDANDLRRKLQSFVNSYSNWLEPGFHCNLQELSICEHWGTSAV